jgi:hypothetical protein
MTDTPASTPAGWFADPAGSGQLRWWNGAAWTEHLAPQPTPEPALLPPANEPVPAPTPLVATPLKFTPEPTPSAQPSWGATSQASAYSMGAAEDFARPAQWNTVGAWLLAFSGLLTIAVGVVHGLMTGFAFTSPYDVGGYLGGYALVFVLMLLFAEADRRKLRSLGYLRIPSLWWMLLFASLVYLIVRTVYVWREVRKGIAPLITYIVVNAASGILISVGVALLIPGLAALGTSGLGTSAQFAAGITRGLDEHGANYSVVCPPVIPGVVGSKFSCVATEVSTRTAHTLNLQVVRGTNGKLTITLLSVTPPITG